MKSMTTILILMTLTLGVPACGGAADDATKDASKTSEHSGGGEHGAHDKHDAAGGEHAGEIVNEKCPIMGDPVDPKITVPYMGKKVGFCCEQCIDKWKALDAAAMAEKLAR